MKQRLFIAINLPPEIKAEIIDTIKTLRKKNPFNLFLRFLYPSTKSAALRGLEETGEKIFFDCKIKSVDLMQSCLSRSGPTYTVVKKFILS